MPAPIAVQLTAKNLKYDKDTITLAANSAVTVTLDNQDSGVLHNFSIYKNSSATDKLFAGDFTTGPETKTYSFTSPPPGTYYFRCDVHPDTMHGTLIVK